ncbi:hypothetical protein [Streptomyces sp. NPDC058240]|uniref:hypothetical protein n=1 Tax=Streptomyces sp. NPDC058240 TaxID=3346396 RepID=UPI0036E64F98
MKARSPDGGALLCAIAGELDGHQAQVGQKTINGIVQQLPRKAEEEPALSGQGAG